MHTVVGLLLDVAMNNYSNKLYVNDAKRSLIRYFENLSKICIKDSDVELLNSYIKMVRAGVGALYNFKVIEAGLASLESYHQDSLLFYTCDDTYKLSRLSDDLPMLLCKDATDLALTSYCISYHMYLKYKNDFDIKYLETYVDSYKYLSCDFVTVCSMLAGRVISFILSGRSDVEVTMQSRCILLPMRDLLNASISEYINI